MVTFYNSRTPDCEFTGSVRQYTATTGSDDESLTHRNQQVQDPWNCPRFCHLVGMWRLGT